MGSKDQTRQAISIEDVASVYGVLFFMFENYGGRKSEAFLRRLADELEARGLDAMAVKRGCDRLMADISIQRAPTLAQILTACKVAKKESVADGGIDLPCDYCHGKGWYLRDYMMGARRYQSIWRCDCGNGHKAEGLKKFCGETMKIYPDGKKVGVKWLPVDIIPYVDV